VVEGDAEGVDVRTGIGACALQQLRRHRLERAHELPRGGERRLAVDPGGAEVAEQRPAPLAEQHVVGLHVAVQDAVAVGLGQCRGQLGADAPSLVGRERPASRHPGVQIAARHLLHDDEAPVAILEIVVDANDVRVPERAHGEHLAAHALARLLHQRRRRHQELHRQAAPHLAVVGLVDHRVAAAPDLAEQLVAIPQHGARARKGAHGILPWPEKTGSRSWFSIMASTRSPFLRQPSSRP
jgi:hypothetical protein